jgi:hypothetical protein
VEHSINGCTQWAVGPQRDSEELFSKQFLRTLHAHGLARLSLRILRNRKLCARFESDTACRDLTAVSLTHRDHPVLHFRQIRMCVRRLGAIEFGEGAT